MSAKRKEITITAGQYKGRKATLISTKNGNVKVNIIEGPIITIPKLFIK